MPLQANTQRKRRGMKANESRQKRKAIIFITLGVLCLFLWIAAYYCLYYFFYPLGKYATGGPPPWYQPLIFAVKLLPVPLPFSIIAEIGFILIFIGLFRLIHSLLRSRR